MTLKVIGAGLGRTGTPSTQQALNALAYRCYHSAALRPPFAFRASTGLRYWPV
jgi:hypothetical protein